MTRPGKRNLFSALGRVVVLVADADAALSFYQDVLGFAVLHDRTAGGYRYLHLGLPGQEPVGLWLMTATTGRERELIGKQCVTSPCSSCTPRTLIRSANSCATAACESGTSGKTPTAGPCTSPICTATASSPRS